MGVLAFDNYDPAEMKKFIIERSEKYHKIRSRLIQHFGDMYWQKMSDAEFMNWTKDIFQLAQNIHTEDELHEYLCSQQTIRLPLNGPMYRVLMIPDH